MTLKRECCAVGDFFVAMKLSPKLDFSSLKTSTVVLVPPRSLCPSSNKPPQLKTPSPRQHAFFIEFDMVFFKDLQEYIRHSTLLISARPATVSYLSTATTLACPSETCPELTFKHLPFPCRRRYRPDIQHPPPESGPGTSRAKIRNLISPPPKTGPRLQGHPCKRLSR